MENMKPIMEFVENFQIPEFEADPKCYLEKNKQVKKGYLKKIKQVFGHQTGGATVCVSACDKGVTEVKKMK